MIIYIALILLFVFLYFTSKNKYSNEFIAYSKKENPFLKLYPLAAFMIDIMDTFTRKTNKKSPISRFEKLYPKGNGKIEYRRFILNRNSIILVVIFTFIILSVASKVTRSNKDGILKGHALSRPINRQDTDISLLVSIENLKNKEIRINIRRRRLTGEELSDYFEEVRKELEERFLNQNESVDKITSSVNFFVDISDPYMAATWKPEDTALISITGKINNEDVKEEGVITYINLLLTYYDEECREYTIPVRVYPPNLSEEELLIKELDKAFREAEEQYLYEDIIYLPEKIMQKDIIFTEKKDSTAILFFIYGVVAVIVIYIILANEIKKKEKYREKQMMLDYSNIISKLTLFLTAGMTIRGAWECIAVDYEKKQKRKEGNGKIETHYAYEEMLITLNEIKVGISESRAYESFGRRCVLIPYIRLVSIIVLNLKKGTSGILPLLEMEKKQAFSERKELSRRLGEEAGTKLQAPLIIYLVIVLAIVIIPAFMSL